MKNKHELPITLPIKKVINEAEGIKSFILPHRLNAKPAQFVMVWIPGIDAKPIGVSYQDEESFGITVSAIGPWSKKMCRMKEGDLTGFMGPYGNHFKLEGKNVVMVGGGYGTALLILLAEQALKSKVSSTIIVGARNEKHLIYRERIKNLGINAVYTTDDGSFGEKGYNTQVLERLLKEGKVDRVYSCGPELMEKRVVELCLENNVPCETSIERYMKCGFGICGACCMDDQGQRLCVEGTVYSGKDAIKILEFGKYHRDASATKHKF